MGFGVHQRSVDISPSDVRREIRSVDGEKRPYLVAPSTFVREGVLNDALVSWDELLTSAQGWNGEPVTAGHPEDARGNYVSANSLDTIGTKIGDARNVSSDSDRTALDGEIWVDERRAYDRGGRASRIAETLAAWANSESDENADEPEPLGISVGYHYVADDRAGTYDGEPYNERHRDIIPDHIALLIDEQGACSIEDGCGVPFSAQIMNDDIELTGQVASGDRVRWESDDLGRQYGVIVSDPDGDADNVMVAVYSPDTSGDSREWTASNSTRRLSVDSLTTIKQFPAISQVSNSSESDSDESPAGHSCSCDDGDGDDDAAGLLNGALNVLDRALGRHSTEPETETDGESDDPTDSKTDKHTMNIDELAEQSAFDTETLESNESLRTKVEQTVTQVTETDDDGDDGGQTADDGDDGATPPSPDGTDEFMTRDQVEELLAAQQQQQTKSSDVEFLATHTDMSEDELSDRSADEIAALREGIEMAGGQSSHSPRLGVNYGGRGRPAEDSDDTGGDSFSEFAAATAGGDDE